MSKICTLGSFWTKYIMFELKKYGRVIFDGTENRCKIWRKAHLRFQNMTNLAKFHRPKNRYFILESKMAELNQNKNSKQRDRPM